MKTFIKLSFMILSIIFVSASYAKYDPTYQAGGLYTSFQYQKSSYEIYSCVVPKNFFGTKTSFSSCNKSGTGWSCSLTQGNASFSGSLTTPHGYDQFMNTDRGMALCDQVPQPNYNYDGVYYNCRYQPGSYGFGAGKWIVEENSCNGQSCNMINLPACNQFGCHNWGGGAGYCQKSPIQPTPPTPDPAPVIVNNPCPSGSSSMNTGGKRMADSTNVGGTLCVEKLTVGFDANGVANSLMTDHSTSISQSISAARSFVNAVRQGGADSTNIGQSPNSASYSDFTLTTNGSGQTQINGANSGVQSFR